MRSSAVFFGSRLGIAFGLALGLAACERRRPDWSAQVDLNPPMRQTAAPVSAPPPASAAVSAPAPAPAPAFAVACARDDAFPRTFAVPEASAAAEVLLRTTPRAREILIVSDSGGNGAALAWQIPSGPSRILRLPLDAAASDDLEGMAWRRDEGEGEGGKLYTLTSSGAVRRFTPDGAGGLARDQDAYALGAPPAACADLRAGNCGRDYEGLCLRRRGSSATCAGYAASKTESALYCLVFRGERLMVHPMRAPIRLAMKPRALSDCAFGAERGPAADVLFVTTNVYAGSDSFIVDEETGKLAALDVPGTLNNEAIAVDADGALYQFMDHNSAPSFGSRMTCTGWPPRAHAP